MAANQRCALLRNGQFYYVIAGRHKQLVLVVEDHARSISFRLEDREIAAIRNKNLDAFEVADKYPSFADHSTRRRSAKLACLITSIAKTGKEFSLR